MPKVPLARAPKKRASRKPLPSTGRARGDALGLVDAVLATREFKSRTILDHVAPEAVSFAAALLVRRAEKAESHRRVWILCPDVKTQDHVHAELAVWQCPALYFPRLGHVAEGVLPDPEALAERTAVLSRMMEGDSPVMVLCADSLGESAPDLAEITTQKRTLEAGAKLDVEILLRELSDAGYERVPVVTERGQFARRGGILDFFAWQAEDPLRLEFFDDELESIRAFDPETLLDELHENRQFGVDERYVLLGEARELRGPRAGVELEGPQLRQGEQCLGEALDAVLQSLNAGER